MISVVVPAFNRPRLLERCLSSICDQDTNAWEIVVVIDGGDEFVDFSYWLSFVESVGGRIVFASRYGPRKGASVCRNIGWLIARWPLILFLDSDDILLPWCLSQRSKFAESLAPRANVFFFYGLQMNGVGEFQPLGSRCFQQLRIFTFELCWQTSSALWSRDALSELGGFNENLACSQDWDIYTRLLLNSEVSVQPSSGKVDFVYDRTVSGISKQRSESHYESDSRLFSNFIEKSRFDTQRLFCLGALHRGVIDRIDIESLQLNDLDKSNFLEILGFRLSFLYLTAKVLGRADRLLKYFMSRSIIRIAQQKMLPIE